MKKKILIIDDEKSIGKLLAIIFKKEGFKAKYVMDPEEGQNLITEYRPNCVITDIKMNKMTGIDILRYVKKVSPHIPVIVMTAYSTKANAIQAVNEGAFYYIEKPFDDVVLLNVVKKALELNEIDKISPENEISKKTNTNNNPIIIGKSKFITDILNLIKKIGKSSTTVLLQGESGTGKELVARKIFEASGREKFLAVNCAALPPNLLESELFGYVKGSFTGALKDKKGYFVAADKGVLFLDEIGELNQNLQVKLLRVLQERVVTPIGSTETIPIDVMVISATNIDIEEKVLKGEFRKDLYYRLNVIPLFLPPLRQRKEDIPELTKYFVKNVCLKLGKKEKKISDELLEVFLNYDWPGNIRELQNIIERIIILEDDDILTTTYLPTKMFAKEKILDEKIITEKSVENIHDYKDVIKEYNEKLLELQKKEIELETLESILRDKWREYERRYQELLIKEKELETKDEDEIFKNGEHISRLTRKILIDELNKTDFDYNFISQKYNINKSTIYRKINMWDIKKKALCDFKHIANNDDHKECDMIIKILNSNNCDITKTAQELGWSRGKLYARMREFNIKKIAY